MSQVSPYSKTNEQLYEKVHEILIQEPAECKNFLFYELMNVKQSLYKSNCKINT